MKSCFASVMIITQKFNEDFLHDGEWYYQAMGIKGHDGIDVKPKDNRDWRMFSVFGGIVIEKRFHSIYGNRIAIWNKEKKIIEYHNHLGLFCPSVSLGDNIKKRTYLGMMGETGKVFGAHNHFAISIANNKGERINRQNGYFGYVDPIPFLE